VCSHPLAGLLSQTAEKTSSSGLEYNGLQDSNQETQEKMTPELLVKHLGEMFQYISLWSSYEQVRSYHIGIERDPVRRPT
jgi:hypothetical protein